MAPDGGSVVLDFWSPSCGPCLAMADDFVAVAEQFDASEVRFAKINTAEDGGLAAPFNIRSVPTLLFIRDGEILDVVIGRMTSHQLGEKVEWLMRRAQRRPGWLARLLGREPRSGDAGKS
jgi:thioredoxin 1